MKHTVNSSMSSVSSSSHVWCSVDLNMVNNQRINIKSLNFGIAFCIFQKLEKEISTLFWPSSLRVLVIFGLGFSANTSTESSEWNNLLLSDYILQVFVCLPDVHLLNSLGCLTGVLKMHPEVWASSLAWFSWVLGVSCVPRHFDLQLIHHKNHYNILRWKSKRAWIMYILGFWRACTYTWLPFQPTCRGDLKVNF